MKIYKEIVRNTEMGIESIDMLVGYTESDKLKELILSQKEELKDFSQKAKAQLNDDESETAEGTMFQKTMLKAGVTMNAAFNRASTHIASMLIDGYNMGITSIQKCINDLNSESAQVPMIAEDLMQVYDKNIKDLRVFL